MKRVRAEQAGGPLPSGCPRRLQRRTEVIPADTGAARKVFQSDDLGLTFYTSLVPNQKKIKNKLDPWDEGKGMCDLCVDVCVILTQQLGSFLESWTDWMGWKSVIIYRGMPLAFQAKRMWSHKTRSYIYWNFLSIFHGKYMANPWTWGRSHCPPVRGWFCESVWDVAVFCHGGMKWIE